MHAVPIRFERMARILMIAGALLLAGAVTAQAQTTFYNEPLDAQPEDWSVSGLWQFGDPPGGSTNYGNPDPNTGFTGNNCWGYNHYSAGATGTGSYENGLGGTNWLITPWIDCTGMSNVTLRFRRWLNVESPAYDHAYLQVTGNGGSTWNTVWENTSAVTDSSWNLVSYDISAIADNSSQVQLRWGIGPTDGSWDFTGWNIDDIELVGTNFGRILEAYMGGDPGWSREGEWAFGQPAGNGNDPGYGFSGPNVFGVNLNGVYSNGQPWRYLYTPAFNTQGYNTTRLHFQRWLGCEATNNYDEHKIQISINGGGWTDIYDAPSSFQDLFWNRTIIDLTAYGADNQASVQIRYGYETDGSVQYSGWNVDDVFVSGIDPTPPSVSSINRQSPGANPTNASQVTFRVTFSEPVLNVGTGNFTLRTTGGQGSAGIAGVSSVGGSPAQQWDVTVNTVNNQTGDIEVELDASTAVITDRAGNSLSGPYTSGQIYTIDRLRPTVNSSIRLDADPTNLATVNFRVTFSESVSGVGTGNFTLRTTGGQGGASITGVSGSGNTRTVSVNTVNGQAGEIELEVDQNLATISDAVGNTMSSSFTGGEWYTVDRVAPTVTGVEIRSGSTVRVTFSEPMGSGATTAGNYVVSGTGRGTLANNPNTVVRVGTTNSYDLTWSGGEMRIGGTITITVSNAQDTVGNTIGSPNSGSDSPGIGVAPTVTSIVRSNPPQQNTNANQVTFAVNFSESVSGVVAGNFTIVATAGQIGSSIAAVGGGAGAWTVTINTQPGNDGNIGLDLDQSLGGVTDAAGNPLSAAFTGSEIYTIDRSTPFITGANPAAFTAVNSLTSIEVTFSESVSGVSSANLTVDSVPVTLASGSGSGPYVFTFPQPADDPALPVNFVAAGVTDVVGNTMAGDLPWTYNLNTANVEVTSLSSGDVSDGGVTNTAPGFTVVFSEAIALLEAGDITLGGPGAAGASVSAINPGGSSDTYTFTVTPGAQGNVTVQIPAGVVNAAAPPNNPNNASGVYSFTWDTVEPTVSSINRLTPAQADTNAAQVEWRVVLSEPINIDSGDLTLTDVGGTISGESILSVFGAGTTWNVVVDTGTGDGTLRLDVVAGTATIVDAAGNALTADFTGQSYNLDKTVPSLGLSSPVGAATNANFTVTATFTEDVTGFADSDIVVGNGTVQSFQTVSPTVYTFEIVPGGAGAVTVDVPAGVASDAAGNGNTAGAPQIATTYDPNAPTLALSSTVGALTNAPFSVTALFSETVTGFAAGDVAVTNGAVSGFTQVTGAEYSFIVTPSTDGAVSVNVGAGVCTDAAGNGNQAAAAAVATTYDGTAPTVAGMVRKTPPTQRANSATVVWTVTFSEPVTGVEAADFLVQILDGDITAPFVFSVTGSGAVYDVTVDTGTKDGEIRLAVPNAAFIADAAGNDYSADYVTGPTYIIDKTEPNVVAITPSTVGPTNIDTISFIVEFDEAIAAFNDAADLLINHGGTAHTGLAIAGGPTTFTVQLTGVSGTGSFTVAVNDASDVADPAGNPLASSVVSPVVQIDNTPPTIISITPTSNSTVAALPSVTIEFDEPVSGVTADDLTATDVDSTEVAFAVSGSNPYQFDLPALDVGIVNIEVLSGGIQDAAGNAFAGLTFDYEIAPVVTVTLTAGVPNGGSTNTSPTLVTATFSEAVSGFELTDVTLTSASATNFTDVGGGVYTFEVTPDGKDQVSIFIAGGVAESIATPGLFSDPSNTYRFTYDGDGPQATNVTPRNFGPTRANSIVFDLTFNEPVLNFNDAADVLIAHNGTSHTAVNVVTGGTTATVTVGGITGDGTFTLAASTLSDVIDAAGNPLAASVVSPAVIIDNTGPIAQSVTALTATPTNASTVSFSVIFNENVAGFDAADDLNLQVSGTVAYTSATVTGGPQSFSVNVTGVTGDGTMQLSVDTGSDVVDTPAGNPIDSSNLSGVVVIDNTHPEILSIDRYNPLDALTSAPTVVFEVTFSEPIFGLGLNNITVVGTDGQTTAAVSSISGTGDIRRVAIATLPATGTVSIDIDQNLTAITDAVGLSPLAGLTVGQAYTVDRLAPSVVSILRDTPATSLTQATQLTFAVTLSKAVTSLTTRSFSVAATGGQTSATLSSVSGSGTDWLVNVQTVANGQGFVGVDLDRNLDLAVDYIGNPIAAPFTTGEDYFVDRAVPRIASRTPASSATVTALPEIRINFTEAVTGVTAGALLVNGSPAKNLTGSGSGPYVFSGYDAPADGLVTVSLDGAAIVDQIGNFVGSTIAWTYTLDPTLLTCAVGSPAILEGALTGQTSVAFEVTFSEDVQGFDSGDLVTTNGLVNNFTAVSASVYSFTVAPQADGEVVVYVPAGAAIAVSNPGKQNVASNAFRFEFLGGNPMVVNIDPAAGSELFGVATITITFDRDVDGVVAGDLTLNGSPATSIGGSGTTFSFSGWALPDDGVVIVRLDSGAIQDLAGNAYLGDTWNFSYTSPLGNTGAHDWSLYR